jgi:hypothetical protein
LVRSHETVEIKFFLNFLRVAGKNNYGSGSGSPKKYRTDPDPEHWCLVHKITVCMYRIYFLFAVPLESKHGCFVCHSVILSLWLYLRQQCFLCHPSNSTVPDYAGIETRTVAEFALTFGTAIQLASMVHIIYSLRKTGYFSVFWIRIRIGSGFKWVSGSLSSQAKIRKGHTGTTVFDEKNCLCL